MSYPPSDISKSERDAGSIVWQAYKSTKPDLPPSADWTQRKLPQELQTIPDDANIPEKLKQIIAWSLILNPSAPALRPQDSPQESTRPSKSPTAARDSKNDGIQIANNDSSRQSIVFDQAESGSASGSRSLRSEQSTKSLSSSERRQSKARYFGHGVFTSTLDLITTFKLKADKEPPSRSEEKKPESKKSSLAECTSCFEDFPLDETAKLPCTHSYCKPCLTALVTTALQTESSYPPKCCLTEIPLQICLLPLDAKQRENYKEKAAEYSVPAQDRWYCPNTKCLKWIPPSKIQRGRHLSQKCPHCATRICSICRGSAHQQSADCPQDFGLEATINLAEMEGWRRCFKCRAMVEVCLFQGCFTYELTTVAE